MASTVTPLASTLETKAGKAITAAQSRVNIASAERDLNMVGPLTSVGLNPTALGDSQRQQPKQVKVPAVQRMFVCA